MLKWMGPLAKEFGLKESRVTDDPLAAIDPTREDQGIYSVSRFNPIFIDTYRESSTQSHASRSSKTKCRLSPQSGLSGEKSYSSGYGGSSEPLYDVPSIVEQNPSYVKSIKISRHKNAKRSIQLSTIPEGKIDFTIPRPIWPKKKAQMAELKFNANYDSLVDEAMLLYTSANYKPLNTQEEVNEISLKEVLVELLNHINATMEGRGVLSPEEMLKRINEKIIYTLEALKYATDEEMRLLCVNLRNSKKLNSVLRAFSHSSQSASDAEEFYHTGSSSSGFSEVKFERNQTPMFVHDDISSVPNGVRNAMIYGSTLCKTKTEVGSSEIKKEGTKSLLKAEEGDKPSVWEMYYGVNRAGVDGYKLDREANFNDVPVFPVGRPEADFTIDVLRSELLSKRMKEDKKWRCRCRLVTTFLGLIFFLLSVMAVSLVLTRGKRMFGSMV